ncbi:MAG: 3-oxoacyl-ACP reductase FabG [Acidobacteria bacterium]|nr:3-oxoacyl-ACP reductase FabG [Acidobacteriota bacterium]
MPRVVLITGGMSGIGLATAEAFQKEGDTVFIVDRQETPAGLGVVRASGGKYFAGDVRDFAAAETIVEQIASDKGRLDVLVNNAGISRDHLLWKMSEADWDEVLAVNLKGAFNFLRAAAPVFRKQQSGKVVNVSSINALRGKKGLANYGASKAGMIALTRTAARELGASNVNVNAVAPGMVETPLTENLPDNVLARSWEEAALGRLGKPQEIADVILFLCSEKARHITGQVIVVDGGQTA